jgi:cell division protein FtsB
MKAVLACGFCILLFGVAGDDHGVRAVLRARRDARTLAERVAALRVENARLRERVGALRRDPQAIEAVARQTLGLVRPGEVMVTTSR